MARIVFLLHGIRTHARWQRGFADVASHHDWKCPLDGWWYGRFSMFQFLTPFARRAKVAWFRSRYTAAFKEHQRIISASSDRLPSVVAHSFGTYILGYALLKYKDIKFDKVILCGSILPREFPWRMLIERGQVNAVRNDVGKQDIWTTSSSWVVPGTGASGSRGFRESCDRLFEHEHNLAHSEFFDTAWMDQNWIPFLEKSYSPMEDRVDATKAIPLPRGDRPVAAFTLSSLILLTYLAVAAALLFVASRYVNPPVHTTTFALQDLQTTDPIHREFDLRYTLAGSSTTLVKHGFATCEIPERTSDIESIDVVKCDGYTFSEYAPEPGSGILWMKRVALDPEHPEDRPPRSVRLFQYVITPQNPLDDRAVSIPSEDEYAAAIDGQPAEIDGATVQTYTLTCDNRTDYCIDILLFRWNQEVQAGQAPPKWSYLSPPCAPGVHDYTFLDKTQGYHFIYGSFCGREARYLDQASLTVQTGRPTLTIRMEDSTDERLEADLTNRSAPPDARGDLP